MNKRNTMTAAALTTLFALSAPALAGAGDDRQNQDTRDNATHLANYVPDQLDDTRYSALGGAARAPEKNPEVGNRHSGVGGARAPEKNPEIGNRLSSFQRLIGWMAVLRF